MKKFLSDKTYGFYVTLGLAVLSIGLMIIYDVSYKGFYSNNKEVFSWGSFICLFIWIIPFAASLFYKKLFRFANYIACICISLSTFFFIYGIYYWISVMSTGIDARFDSTFFLNAIMFIVLWIGSLVNVFLPQIKTKGTIKE